MESQWGHGHTITVTVWHGYFYSGQSFLSPSIVNVLYEAMLLVFFYITRCILIWCPVSAHAILSLPPQVQIAF